MMPILLITLLAHRKFNIELLSGITKEFDITTIINTHDMNSVMGIGENILFIYQGQKVFPIIELYRESFTHPLGLSHLSHTART